MSLKVGVDIDGTATMLDPKELLAASIKTGQPVPLTPGFVGYCLRNAPLMPGVKESLKELAERPDTDVQFVTNRPEFFSEITGKWVRDLDLPVTEYQCMGECSKGDVMDLDVIIDNSPHNVLSVVDNGGIGILFDPDGKYDSEKFDSNNTYVVRDWNNVVDIIVQQTRVSSRKIPVPV